MAEGKYSKYVIEEPITFSVFKEVTSPQFLVSGERNLEGLDFTMGWSFLTEPFIMIPQAHKHDYNQIIGFIGGNPVDIRDFGAEVEMSLGDEEEKYIVTSTTFFYIPKGLTHGPLNVKTVNKPIMFIDVVLSPGAAGAGGRPPAK